jgi:type II secretory ATPase GspE/PulE/Tfp pilus assembly ATPase PilB-like protein
MQARSHTHIIDYQQLPEHEGILSSGSDSLMDDDGSQKLVVPQSKVRELMALRQSNRRFFVLSSEAELRSSAWYYLINRGKALGLVFNGFATASAEIFHLLTYRDKNRSESDAVLNDARVIEQIVAGSSPLEWFRTIVQRCLDVGASDLHLELRGATAILRVRLDGLMRTLSGYPVQVAMEGISAAYTVLAEERSRTEVAFNAGVAQAAMIPLDLPSQRVTLRYQSHPAVGGLDVVIRILKAASSSAQTRLLTLDRLGFTPWQVEQLEASVSSAWGGLFIAGITGSGKTTTLNTLMAMLARSATRKLITIEDPVEYELPGVTHMSIQRKAESGPGADPFHAAMLAFLRMDPDVGLFGEIRDRVSAGMAQAAIQTGHKILSTVHATSSLGIVSRLSSEGIGLKRADLCSPEFISALVYQVLVPVNCPHCKRPAREVMSPEQLHPYAVAFGLDVDSIYCSSDTGCSHCRKPGIDYSVGERNGIKGVKVGAEVIVPDTQMLELLLAGRDMEARRHWRSLQSEGFSSPNMAGKEAWGHVLFDVAEGRVDPYYFERTFGNVHLLARSLQRDSR